MVPRGTFPAAHSAPEPCPPEAATPLYLEGRLPWETPGRGLLVTSAPPAGGETAGQESRVRRAAGGVWAAS